MFSGEKNFRGSIEHEPTEALHLRQVKRSGPQCGCM